MVVVELFYSCYRASLKFLAQKARLGSCDERQAADLRAAYSYGPRRGRDALSFLFTLHGGAGIHFRTPPPPPGALKSCSWPNRAAGHVSCVGLLESSLACKRVWGRM